MDLEVREGPPSREEDASGLASAASKELRRLGAAVEALTQEITSLRRAVLEWPELEQLGQDVQRLEEAVREAWEHDDDGADPDPEGDEDGLDEVMASIEGLRKDLVRFVAELHERSQERSPLTLLAPVVEELSAVRGDLDKLRRRLPVRAASGPRGEPVVLSDDQLDRLAEQVVQRLAASFELVTDERSAVRPLRSR